MKQYKLVITTYAENERYAVQKQEYDQKALQRYGVHGWPNDEGQPRQWDEERALEVTLTAEEFHAIKGAVLECFK